MANGDDIVASDGGNLNPGGSTAQLNVTVGYLERFGAFIKNVGINAFVVIWFCYVFYTVMFDLVSKVNLLIQLTCQTAEVHTPGSCASILNQIKGTGGNGR
jgi:hypothetical protein